VSRRWWPTAREAADDPKRSLVFRLGIGTDRRRVVTDYLVRHSVDHSCAEMYQQCIFNALVNNSVSNIRYSCQ
jgi:hypothetical protein